jgi:hypothetical protein
MNDNTMLASYKKLVEFHARALDNLLQDCETDPGLIGHLLPKLSELAKITAAQKLSNPLLLSTVKNRRIIVELDADPDYFDDLLENSLQVGIINMIQYLTKDLPVEGSIVGEWCETSKLINRWIEDNHEERL